MEQTNVEMVDGNPVSPWFEDEQPVHNGMYQRKSKVSGLIFYAYFFKGTWYLISGTQEGALQNAKLEIPTTYQNAIDLPWRGITA